MLRKSCTQIVIILISATLLAAQQKTISLTASQQRAIQKVMQAYDSVGSPGAALLVMDRGKIIYQQAYGYKNLSTSVKVDLTTCFRLASLSKQFTAMCILQLVQAGKLSLDDPIRLYLDSLPTYTDNIKVRNLLTHTSGLVDYEDLIPQSQTWQVLDIDCKRLMNTTDHLYFQPGTAYRYSNTGFALLALIVQKVSGQDFATYLQQHIFQPLQMKASLALEKGKTFVPNRAMGHSRTKLGWIVTDQSVTSAVLGDGGIYTNVQDMAKWLRAICSYKLIPADLQQQAWNRAILNTGVPIDYGFGWHVEDFRGKAHPYHSGSSIGFRNHVLLFPENQRAIIILTNRDEGDPMIETKKIMDIIWPVQ